MSYNPSPCDYCSFGRKEIETDGFLNDFVNGNYINVTVEMVGYS